MGKWQQKKSSRMLLALLRAAALSARTRAFPAFYRAIIGTSPHAPAANPQPAGLVRAHRDADASLAMHASTVAAVGPLRWWALGPKDIGRCRALCQRPIASFSTMSPAFAARPLAFSQSIAVVLAVSFPHPALLRFVLLSWPTAPVACRSLCA